MLIIGDIHGRFDKYLEKIEGEDKTFQLGDMGLGFPGDKEFIIIQKFVKGIQITLGILGYMIISFLLVVLSLLTKIKGLWARLGGRKKNYL